MTSILDIPQDLIRIILYDYLEANDIRICLNTSKIFNVLYPYQLAIVKSCYLGWDYLIIKGSIEACEYWAKRNNIDLLNASGDQLKVKVEYHYTNTINPLNIYHIMKYTIVYPRNTDEEYPDNFIFKEACKHGNLSLVKSLLKKSNEIGTPINIHCFDDYAFIMACLHNQVHIVDFLYHLDKQGYELLLSDEGSNSYLFHSLYCLGHINTIQYFHSKINNRFREFPIDYTQCVKYHLKNDTFLDWVFKDASSKNRDLSHILYRCCEEYSDVKYLIKLTNIYINTFSNINWDMLYNSIYYVKDYGLEYLSYLHECNSEYLNNSKNLTDLLELACIGDKLNIAKYLYNFVIQNKIKIENLASKNRNILGNSIFRVSIELIEWILNTFKDINIHSGNEYAFMTLCYTNQLDKAKYLYNYSIKTSKKKRRAPHDKIIDVQISNNAALRYAYKNLYIEMCIWLISIGADKEILIPIIKNDDRGLFLKKHDTFYNFILNEYPQFEYYFS